MIPVDTLLGGCADPSQAVLEYKFIIKEGPTRVIRWEEGKNHVLPLQEQNRSAADKLRGKGISSPHLAPADMVLEMSPLGTVGQPDKAQFLV